MQTICDDKISVDNGLSRDYDILLSSITACSHAAGYDINVNTKTSIMYILKKVRLFIAALLLQKYTDVLSKVTLFNKLLRLPL
jgi:hypothetical protein